MRVEINIQIKKSLESFAKKVEFSMDISVIPEGVDYVIPRIVIVPKSIRRDIKIIQSTHRIKDGIIMIVGRVESRSGSMKIARLYSNEMNFDKKSGLDGVFLFADHFNIEGCKMIIAVLQESKIRSSNYSFRKSFRSRDVSNIENFAKAAQMIPFAITEYNLIHRGIVKKKHFRAVSETQNFWM